jgi:hypothetical protein
MPSKVPLVYFFFKDVCDKRALDRLFLRCIAIDHKIELI